MPSSLPFAQLWLEEEEYLRRVVAGLPAGAVVVDIGTAQGGSAWLMATAARDGCSFFTYDLAPSAEAYARLEKLGVRIEAVDSVRGAHAWPSTCGRPIDLLLVDGSHTLSSVYRDYEAWVAHLRPGARILFHDYDPIERGGVAHLGVRVFLDALLGSGALSDVEHVGRFLAANVGPPDAAAPSVETCRDAWLRIGERVTRLGVRDHRGRTIVGRAGRRGDLLAAVLRLDGAHWLEDAADVRPPADVLIVERPLSDSGRRLLAAGAPGVELLDDLAWGYLLLEALRGRRDMLLARAADRRGFFKHEEYVEMLEHATSAPASVAEIFSNATPRTLAELSRVCARELLRLVFLLRIGEALIGDDAPGDP